MGGRRRRQGPSHWPQSSRLEMRTNGNQWNFLQEQAEVLAFLEEKMKCQPCTRSIPSPSPVQDLQTGCPWNVALQITLRRLRAFEGVPPRYQRVKKQVAPHAMRSICLAPG